ncbi:excisionase [Luxibacter massiliensis]|uniref:excisionase n=1 Tax=Luxibacter massiliensis TaxID=2219695 RepID=UPI000F06B712|nr:excisionase [Luxibacter massiliensis]
MKIPASGEKNILNQEEAIVHFGLSRRKFYKLLKEGKDTPFMALYGTRRLIIRTEFEKYLKLHSELKRRGS